MSAPVDVPSNAHVSIEDMDPADLDAVLGIDLEAFHARDVGDARALRETQLREELARPFARIRVARSKDGAVVGYWLAWFVVDEVHLLNVAVASASRRSGIGRALVRDLVDEAARRHAAKILLEVRRSNVAARSLYESLGFEAFNERKAYYDDGEDAVEMWLHVTP